ncbi:hypothetical protein ACFYE8_33560 [Rhizobium leguminosarum]|uniref:hypothetical protein n=1 Tax=Rhizobium leguminosarum TaxID=384 RepID=UPI0036D7AF8C
MRPSILLVGLPLIIGGCASTLAPDVIAKTDAEQAYSAHPVRYRSPISGYVSRQPVDPKPWRQQNQQQSPQNGDAS